MKHKVLVIIRHRELAELLRNNLQSKQVEVHIESSLNRGHGPFIRECYTLAIVELQAGEYDGIDILTWLHLQDPIPLVALSSAPSKAEERRALAAGADQYWGVPFDIGVVVPYIFALMRRYEIDHTDHPKILRFSYGLKINLHTQTAYWHGEPLNLHPKQFLLLASMGEQIGQVATKEHLYTEVWNDNYDVSCDETLKYHISKIREELHAHGADNIIRTYWGVGYGLREESEEADA